MRGSSSIADIKALLQGRIDQLVRDLAPDGSLQHGYWMARNPARDDRNPGSFWVIVNRPGKTPGAWRDEATGAQGDIIDLICNCRGLDRGEALAFARKWLNYEDLPPQRIQQARADQARRQADDERLAAVRLEEARKKAFGVYVWSKKRPFAGSPADVYLRSRAIDVRELPRFPGALGWMPEAHHVETRTKWPAMVAGFSAPDGRIVAIHRTFLAHDGSGKAPVSPQRKIWPAFAGAAIRLSRGESGLPIDEAIEHGIIDVLCLCEGVEDGLSIALAKPEWRVWAAGSLGNLAHIKVPRCIERIVVAADNDWGKPQAEKALKEALRALAYQGRPVAVARSTVGKDMNDALRGNAA